MIEWRSSLYPLGFLAALIFGLRFIIQWLQSEKAQKSIVPPSFWKLSLIGNLLLAIHSFIQIQYHVCLVQACNAVISWRNINLMQNKHSRFSFSTTLFFIIGVIFLVTIAFALQDEFLIKDGNWFRIPTVPWRQNALPSASLSWHLLGTIAYFLFSIRFWIQWWFAEKMRVNQLPLTFWWLSLVGAFLSIIYFLRIGDSVNLIGPLLGIIPYFRNLMLMYQTEAVKKI